VIAFLKHFGAVLLGDDCELGLLVGVGPRINSIAAGEAEEYGRRQKKGSDRERTIHTPENDKMLAWSQPRGRRKCTEATRDLSTWTLI
jgi:hypothetical protein